MKKFVSVFFVTLIIFILFFSIFKMVYFIKNNNLGDFKNKDNMNLSIPKSFKYDYFLVKGSWELFKNSNELHLGNKYFLIQSVLENDKCFLGLFFLTKIYNNNLIFKSDKSKYQSKMFKYANINSLNIITYIYAQNEINILTSIQNCNDWVKIKND